MRVIGGRYAGDADGREERDECMNYLSQDRVCRLTYHRLSAMLKVPACNQGKQNRPKNFENSATSVDQLNQLIGKNLPAEPSTAKSTRLAMSLKFG